MADAISSVETVRVHQLDRDVVHYAWDNSIPPRLEIEPGEIVVLRCRDDSDGYFHAGSTTADFATRPPWVGHPLTGPVRVRGAQPGDILQVDILELVPGDFGYTACRPGRGLLPDDFPEPFLKLWNLSEGGSAEFKSGIRVPLEPFLGVMGVAPAEPGEHSTAPPRASGGNMDVKQLTAGTTLYLPIFVEGALFSCGDGHGAQGDGEVCITAIETTMTATLRLSVRTGLSLEAPELRTGGPVAPKTNVGPHYATMGIAPDLMEATRKATRSMIRYLVREHGLAPVEAYALASVAVDLKVSEVVDAPNWVVSAFLPLSIFRTA